MATARVTAGTSRTRAVPRGDRTLESSIECLAVVDARMVRGVVNIQCYRHIDNGLLSWSDGEAHRRGRALWRA